MLTLLALGPLELASTAEVEAILEVAAMQGRLPQVVMRDQDRDQHHHRHLDHQTAAAIQDSRLVPRSQAPKRRRIRQLQEPRHQHPAHLVQQVQLVSLDPTAWMACLGKTFCDNLEPNQQSRIFLGRTVYQGKTQEYSSQLLTMDVDW